MASSSSLNSSDSTLTSKGGSTTIGRPLYWSLFTRLSVTACAPRITLGQRAWSLQHVTAQKAQLCSASGSRRHRKADLEGHHSLGESPAAVCKAQPITALCSCWGLDSKREGGAWHADKMRAGPCQSCLR